MGWVREGSCPPEQCQGRCCKHIGTWYEPTPETKAFLSQLQIRGVDVKEVELEGGTTKLLVDYPQTCQWLTKDNLCGLHPDMNPSSDKPPRPDFCGDWPTHPNQLINDDCGFSFRWQSDD